MPTKIHGAAGQLQVSGFIRSTHPPLRQGVTFPAQAFEFGKQGFLIVKPPIDDRIEPRQPSRRSDGPIGRREIKLVQLIGGNPKNRLVFQPLRVAAECIHLPNVQQHLPIPIIMAYFDQRSGFFNGD